MPLPSGRQEKRSPMLQDYPANSDGMGIWRNYFFWEPLVAIEERVGARGTILFAKGCGGEIPSIERAGRT